MTAPESRWRRARRVAALIAGFALVLAVGYSSSAIRHARAAGLLLRLESGDPTGPHDGVAAIGQRAIEEVEAPFDGDAGRAYRPTDVVRPPGIVLVHGVHFRGIEDPRLADFARALASAGYAVFTPAMPSLSGFELDADVVDRIARVARHHARALDRPAVGVIGISFAGGLALLAAANATDRDAIAWVVSVGGHHSMERVARFWVGNRVQAPDGERADAAPHPYGAAVLVRSFASDFFPPDDVAGARVALRALLEERGREARAHLASLSPEGRGTLASVFDRDPAFIPRYLEVVDARQGALAAVSPAGRVGRLSVPVLLVHGRSDPVVPFVETRWLATEIPSGLLRAATVTTALDHTELDAEPALRERWSAIGFVATLLETADSEGP